MKSIVWNRGQGRDNKPHQKKSPVWTGERTVTVMQATATPPMLTHPSPPTSDFKKGLVHGGMWTTTKDAATVDVAGYPLPILQSARNEHPDPVKPGYVLMYAGEVRVTYRIGKSYDSRTVDAVRHCFISPRGIRFLVEDWSLIKPA